MKAFIFLKTFLTEMRSSNMRCTHRLLAGVWGYSIGRFHGYAHFISMKIILQAPHICLTLVSPGISIWSQCFQVGYTTVAMAAKSWKADGGGLFSRRWRMTSAHSSELSTEVSTSRS